MMTIHSMMYPIHMEKPYGTSMEPAISSGDNVLIIEPRSEKELKIGDIVKYSIEDKNILHRIIFIGEDVDGWYAILKGDAEDCPDGLICFLDDEKTKSIVFKIRFNQILGKVIQ